MGQVSVEVRRFRVSSELNVRRCFHTIQFPKHLISVST